MTVIDILALMADGRQQAEGKNRHFTLSVEFAQALAEISPKLTPLEMNMMIRIGRELCLNDAASAVSALEADAQIARIMKASRSAGE